MNDELEVKDAEIIEQAAPIEVKEEIAEINLADIIQPEHPEKHRKNLSKKIIALKTTHPDLTTHQIAKVAGCTHQNVSKTLKRYNVDVTRVEEYKANKIALLESAQEKILSDLLTNDESLKKESYKNKSLAYAVLFDKIRLLENKSTSNIALSKVVELIDKNQDNE